jgi:bifunctional non-homologous end joining protein LigD
MQRSSGRAKGRRAAFSPTQRTLLSMLDPASVPLVRRRDMPTSIRPMLATLAAHAFSDPAWLFEPKLDGQRSILWKHGRDIRLLTRNQKDRTAHYPDLVRALATPGRPRDVIADGEIVAFQGDRTSFSRLQDRMQNAAPSQELIAQVPVFYYLFDLIWAEGLDLSTVPLRARKSLLFDMTSFEDPIRFSDHLDAEGEAAFRAACGRGWEGIVAKRADSPYVQRRSRDWLKFKCVNEQEFVVVGWTDPSGSRVGLGALLVGFYEGDQLRFAGKVGTGFRRHELERLRKQLGVLEVPEPVAGLKGLPRAGVHWVRPELVVQVGFGEWTQDGKLRHPRFLGIREDKAPAEVVREEQAV